MQRNNTNIYKSARQRAGLTQERAAELLALSVESVKAYETGVRVPPPAAVASMAEVYGSPGLRLEHARATDELGIIPEDAQAKPLIIASVQLYNYMLDWAEKHRGQQLLKIAEDGVIDEAELPLFNQIVCEVEGLAAVMLSLMCCEIAKKERPDVGASKRSVAVDFPITQTTSLLYQKVRESQGKPAAGKAVDLT